MKKIIICILAAVLTVLNTVAAVHAQIAGINAQATSIQVDPSSGSASLPIKIQTPPGRGGIEPNLALVYSSSDNHSLGLAGVGWDMSLGFVQLSMKKGAPKYDTTDTYTLNGMDLVYDASAGFYRTEIEGSFAKVTKQGTGFVMVDKKGTKYFYGSSSASLLNDYNNNPSRIFRWLLDRVEDINGNYMTIAYVRSGTVLLPQTIEYTGNSKTSPALTPGIRVSFAYTAAARTSVIYKTGFYLFTPEILSNIKIWTGPSFSQLQSTYTFNYSPSANSKRDLLRSIVQSGSDGSSAFPAITFTYNENIKGFNLTPVNWAGMDAMQYHVEDGDMGVRPIDFNGDGYTDFIRRVMFSNGAIASNILVNNKANHWDPLSTWNLDGSSEFLNKGTYVRDMGVRFADINGDGWVDIVRAYRHDPSNNGGQDAAETRLNNGTNAFVVNIPWKLSGDMGFMKEYNAGGLYAVSNGSQLVDVNGDGFVDVAIANAAERKTYINNKGANPLTGTGFTIDGTWTLPSDVNLADGTTQFVDLDGDGMADLFSINAGVAKTWMNTGRGWLAGGGAIWQTTLPFFPDLKNGKVQFADINGDGYQDLLYFDTTSSRVLLNTGRSGWVDATAEYPLDATVRFDNASTMLIDANADGMLDYMADNKLYLNKSMPADILTGLNNGIGVTTAITYDVATRFSNTFLPFAFPVVKSIATTAGSKTYTTTYSYSGGNFDSTYREFTGFKTVRVTDPDGHYTVTNFDQRHFYKGRVLDTATYDKNNKLFAKSVNTWGEVTLVSQPDLGVLGPNTSKFIFLKQTDNYTYEGQATPRRTQQQMFYDSYGNVTKTINFGEVNQSTGADIGTDKTTTTVDYVHNTSAWLIGFPYRTQVLDNANAMVGQTLFYYDNATTTTATPTLGRLTRKDEYLNATTNHTTTYAYETAGNLTSTTDPLNKTTTITYDSTYNIFPVQTTNALSQSVKTYYYGVNSSSLSSDPMYNTGLKGLWGQTMAVVDANNQKVFKHYDALGRLLKTYGPLDSFTYPTSSTSYQTYSNYVQVLTQNRITSGQAGTLDESNFYDGLGRLIETKRPSATAGQFIASNQKTYNSRGLVEKAFLPLTVTTNLNTLDATPANTKPKVSFLYDAMGRKCRTTNPDATYANAVFGIWQVTATDENGHRLISKYDAYGRLASKEEWKGADGRHAAYPAATFVRYATTTYQYDVKGNLKSVTDAKGNVTTITYDALGRKTAMSDPDMHNWTYTYDANGNLTSQTDANTKTMTFTYDALNRLKTKTDGTTTFGNFGYDGTSNGYAVGRLTGASSSAVGTSNLYSYDQLGREVTDDVWVASYHYAPTTKTYDALNRLVKVNYPDGTNTIAYKYNSAGQPIEVSKLNTDGTINTKFVQNITYNANGLMLTILYGNNVTTTYSYDPLNFRLTRIVTQLAGASTKLQDLSYTYDGVGNILTIVDAVNSASQTFKYDELNRLVSAIAPAAQGYGTKTYAYDEIGNIIQKDGLTYTYGAGGAGKHAVTSTSDGTSYQYDANGNMIKKITLLGEWTYVYDTENRLIAIGYAPIGKSYKSISTYAYDASGKRYQKVVYRHSDPAYNNPDTYNLMFSQIGYPLVPAGGVTTSTTTYAGDYYEAEDNRFTKKVFLGSTLVAAMNGGVVNYYHTDHLGSVNVLSDSTGVSRSLTEYDPYGKISRFERFGGTFKTGWEAFNGKRLDDESGLLFYGGRYYDPKLGRFITADTIVQSPKGNPQTLNRYTYCNNNPTSLIDPDGHWWFIVALVIKAVVAVSTTTVAIAGAIGPALTAFGAFAAAHPFLVSAAFSLLATSIGVANGSIRSLGQAATQFGIGTVANLAGLGAGIGVSNFIGQAAGSLASTTAGQYVAAALVAGSGALVATTIQTTGSVVAEGGKFTDGLSIAVKSMPTVLIGSTIAATATISLIKVSDAIIKANAAKAVAGVTPSSSAQSGTTLTSNRSEDILEYQTYEPTDRARIAVRAVGDTKPIDSLENAKYTLKVLEQRQLNDFHNFPDAADSFAATATKTVAMGKDGNLYTTFEIKGDYRGRDGTYQWIVKHEDMTINHRLFKPVKGDSK